MEEREYLEKILECDLDLSSYELYIWGTGNTSDLYQEGLKRLEEEGITINGYFDNNSSKWGKTYGGKSILSPDEVTKINHPLILVSTPRPKIIREIGERTQAIETGVEELVEARRVANRIESIHERAIRYHDTVCLG